MQSYEKIGKLPILAMLKIRMQPLFTSFFCLKTPSLHFFFTIFIRFYSIIIMYYRNSMILRDKKRRLKQNVYALFTQTWKKHLRETRKCLIFSVDQLGLEPRTSRLWVCCSNQLSYKSGDSLKSGSRMVQAERRELALCWGEAHSRRRLFKIVCKGTKKIKD